MLQRRQQKEQQQGQYDRQQEEQEQEQEEGQTRRRGEHHESSSISISSNNNPKNKNESKKGGEYDDNKQVDESSPYTSNDGTTNNNNNTTRSNSTNSTTTATGSACAGTRRGQGQQPAIISSLVHQGNHHDDDHQQYYHPPPQQLLFPNGSGSSNDGDDKDKEENNEVLLRLVQEEQEENRQQQKLQQQQGTTEQYHHCHNEDEDISNNHGKTTIQTLHLTPSTSHNTTTTDNGIDHDFLHDYDQQQQVVLEEQQDHNDLLHYKERHQQQMQQQQDLVLLQPASFLILQEDPFTSSRYEDDTRGVENQHHDDAKQTNNPETPTEDDSITSKSTMGKIVELETIILEGDVNAGGNGTTMPIGHDGKSNDIQDTMNTSTSITSRNNSNSPASKVWDIDQTEVVEKEDNYIAPYHDATFDNAGDTLLTSLMLAPPEQGSPPPSSSYNHSCSQQWHQVTSIDGKNYKEANMTPISGFQNERGDKCTKHNQSHNSNIDRKRAQANTISTDGTINSDGQYIPITMTSNQSSDNPTMNSSNADDSKSHQPTSFYHHDGNYSNYNYSYYQHYHDYAAQYYAPHLYIHRPHHQYGAFSVPVVPHNMYSYYSSYSYLPLSNHAGQSQYTDHYQVRKNDAIATDDLFARKKQKISPRDDFDISKDATSPYMPADGLHQYSSTNYVGNCQYELHSSLPSHNIADVLEPIAVPMMDNSQLNNPGTSATNLRQPQVLSIRTSDINTSYHDPTHDAVHHNIPDGDIHVKSNLPGFDEVTTEEKYLYEPFPLHHNDCISNHHNQIPSAVQSTNLGYPQNDHQQYYFDASCTPYSSSAGVTYMTQYSTTPTYNTNNEGITFQHNDNTKSTHIPKGKKKSSKRDHYELRRPLSAYNFFFSEERDIILALLPSPTTIEGTETSQNEFKDVGNNKGFSGSENPTDTMIREMTVDQLQEFLSQRVLPPNEIEELKNKSREKTQQILETQFEGDKVKKPHRKSHGKISFQKLASIIGRRWQEKSKEEKQRYYDLAKSDLERFIRLNPNGSRKG
jgi:hypothetical protein